MMTLPPTASATDATVQAVVPLALPDPPVAWFVQLTTVTPTLSDAVPPSATVEEEVAYVGEEVGEVIAQVGEVGSYVTVMTSVPTFAAASRARTVMTLFPATSATLPILQLVVPLAVPDAAVAALVHVTWVTPTSSEAVPPRPTLEDAVAYVASDVGAVIVHVGAIVEYITVIVSPPTFPAASRARTTTTLSPTASATPVIVQLVVPLAVPEPPVAWFVHVTTVTPMLSEAVPPRSTVAVGLVYVGDDVGELIVQVGDVGS
jgi:hypothetical protein